MRAQLERIATSPESSVNGVNLIADAFPAPWHFHPQFELTFIRRGEGMRHVGDHLAPFSAGDLALLGPNLPHMWKSYGKCAGSAHAYVLQWPVELIPAGGEFVAIHRLLEQACRGLVYAGDESVRIGAQMRQLLTRNGLNRFVGLVALLDELSRHTWQPLTEGNYLYDRAQDSHSRLNRALAFVQENYASPIRLGQLAQVTGFSEQQFSRFFQRTMNRSFSNYLMEYRLLRAADTLLSTELPVARIAQQNGFPSLPLFHRKFKQKFHCTPLQYRRK
ncbi:AraC family transcriptional regulator [Simiduia agarivorans]|uniref:Transcriptional activator n=1 Tax=Simiduia agarivorans (strain DSM 21679 / JCM 13881 / BCRC 17597 / SA1) TaxID=1117647 RepID=K4KN51_SIMAS|nr:AraC family transcriptional regulator [Simiduia agarivorans]AFV00462.1 putative transcriptional activator [Simiduia agarivorans SA1 = DSM 21679]